MQIKDYFNEDILREIALDKEKLKEVAKKDNGFILKQLEKFNISVSKDFIENINTAASIVYLFNHFTLTEDEKVKYSVNFKNNSLIMNSITE